MQLFFKVVFWSLVINTAIAFMEGFSGIDVLGAVALTAWSVWSLSSE